MSRRLFGSHRFDLLPCSASTTVVDFRNELRKTSAMSSGSLRKREAGAPPQTLLHPEETHSHVALEPDGLEGDDCEDDVVSAHLPRRHPFSAIIAKWSCAVHESQESQHSQGALSEDEEGDDVSDYDLTDSLIDNEELVKVFKRKCRSRMSGGFCVLDEDEESSEEVSDESDEDSQAEERSGSKRCSRACEREHECEKRPRLGLVRARRGLQWLGDGTAAFKKVKAVTDAIQERLGENCEKLEAGGESLTT